MKFADAGGGGTANPTGPDPAPAPADPAPPEPAGVPDGLPPNDPNGEGATQEEIAATMKSSGVTLPPEPTPAAADEEEGDDPDPADPATPPEPAADPATPPEPPAPEPTDEEIAAAPIEPAAGDEKYAFEVTDANGATFKIAPGATMEEILADFEPKNNGQILDILNQLQKAEAAKAADDATEAENTSKQEQAQRVSEIRSAWDAEVTDLTAQKRIPEGDDGKARIDEVYKFMADENTKRMEAGRPTIGSFEDALDKLEAKENREAKVAADKADKDAARANGGKVGGSSAPATSGPIVYRPGSARNSGEAIRAMGLIK